jgi:hypothetical protein
MDLYASIDIYMNNDTIHAIQVDKRQHNKVLTILNQISDIHKRQSNHLWSEPKEEWAVKEEEDTSFEPMPLFISITHLEGTLYLNPHAINSIEILHVS